MTRPKVLLVLLSVGLACAGPLGAENATSNANTQQQTGPRVVVGTVPGGSIQGANDNVEVRENTANRQDSSQGFRRDAQSFSAFNQGFQPNQPNNFGANFAFNDFNKGAFQTSSFGQFGSPSFQQQPLQQGMNQAFAATSAFQNPQQGGFGQFNAAGGAFDSQFGSPFNQQPFGPNQQQQDTKKSSSFTQQDNKQQQQQQSQQGAGNLSSGQGQATPIKRETSSSVNASRNSTTDFKRNPNDGFGPGDVPPPFFGPNGPFVPQGPPMLPPTPAMHPFQGAMPFQWNALFGQDFNRFPNLMVVPMLVNPAMLGHMQDFNPGFGQFDPQPQQSFFGQQALPQRIDPGQQIGQQQGVPQFPRQEFRTFETTTGKI